MPILSDFSRRFQLLTTDAKPDPPRVPIQDYTNNLQQNNEEEKKRKFSIRQLISKKNNCEQSNIATPLQRQKSAPSGDGDGDGGGVTTPFTTSDFSPKKPKNLDNDDNDIDKEDLPSTNTFREYKKPNVKTKTKSRTTKPSQSANVVNYNIVNSNGVKIGARTSYICNINNFTTDKSVPMDTTNCSKPKSRLMPENVESLTRCEDEITFDDMFIIKTHIGHGWKDVARRLSYSDGQIEQFEENYRHKGVDEIMYQLLLDWKQANTKDAQIGNLIDVLWFCQEYDCAERVANSRTKL
ncbi:PREDICTED: uncharacterized protein LOC107070659 [Polistes dominula]|uniref:Uncharacterized protein LOC107070659 n=1 Tax=Polistes dominula TaxID=743375 RepID=A0ABM1IWH0_POLDO|nr:PREDICTED: uncharacterized protein LOC107070659 [Polistes dominula]XP_015184557.1 PREDICTED: uncharacterized protein LOC107070659 [Polistes dominula]XP_015184558.1 PREDICTED: uncharacterized protein LOC107070659 [Polistes dominula]